LVAYSFKEKEKKPRKFSVCVAFAIIQKDIFIILLIRLLGYLSKVLFILSVGKVL